MDSNIVFEPIKKLMIKFVNKLAFSDYLAGLFNFRNESGRIWLFLDKSAVIWAYLNILERLGTGRLAVTYEFTTG